MHNFSELYDQYASDIYRFALWLSRDPMDAEDITAETFVRAWVRIGSIRMETLKGYLLKIARNVFLTRQRKRRRDKTLEESFQDPSPGPEAMTEVRSTLANVNAFLQTLPECDRTAFMLRVQYDLPYAEIARVLEVSEVSTRVKVHRTRKKLLMESVEEQGGR